MCPILLEPTCVARADEAFWDAFCASTWNARPVHLRFGEPPLAVEEADVFDAAVAASAEHRERTAGNFVNVYVNGHRRPSDFDHLLPAREDGSLARYAGRVVTTLGQPDFGFVLFGCQRFSVPLWRAGRKFLAPLFARVGVPTGYAEIDAFSGPYDRTPFGIHKDNAANFSFVMAGAKSMLFWPATTFRNRMPGHPGFFGRSDYETFADVEGAVRIDARAGDVIFWPSTYWHIAMSDPALAWTDAACPTTMNFALYERVGPTSCLVDAVAALLPRAAAPDPTYPVSTPHDEVPHVVVGELAALRAALAGGALEERLHEDWLRYVSAGGFRAVSSLPTRAALRHGDRVSLSAGSRVLWRRGARGLTIASNGTLLRCRDVPGVPRLIAKLTCGETLYVGVTDADVSAADAAALLEKLYTSDALRVETPAPTAPPAEVLPAASALDAYRTA